MKKYGIILALLLLTGSCGLVKKKTSYSDTRRVHVDAGDIPDGKPAAEINRESAPALPKNTKAEAVIESALEYTGTRYKYGGTTRKGMDCSGLLYVSFLENDIPFPRSSYNMADEGKRVKLSQIQKGDLLFFKTKRGGKKVNHVGLVVDVEDEEIKFIHSTTSRGVIVSSLREGYWNYSFVKATRIF
ncbi:MAG: C40 family peptidase [Robiginitalea sp.]|jgi:cell wall-associated NlpC family hydrolase